MFCFYYRDFSDDEEEAIRTRYISPTIDQIHASPNSDQETTINNPSQSGSRAQVQKSTPRPPKRKKSLEKMSAFESSFVKLAQAQSERLERQQQRHPMDAFFESCAMRAKQLTRAKQAWLQMQVSALMYNAEFLEDSGSRQPTYSGLYEPGASYTHHQFYPANTATSPPVTGSEDTSLVTPPPYQGQVEAPLSGLDMLSQAMTSLQ